MITNPTYKKGFDAGYRIGVNSGLNGSCARVIMEHDLEYMYGALCMVLKDNYGWDSDAIQDICGEIQGKWESLEQDKEIPGEKLIDMVERETGVQLKQMAETILESGKEAWESD